MTEDETGQSERAGRRREPVHGARIEFSPGTVRTCSLGCEKVAGRDGFEALGDRDDVGVDPVVAGASARPAGRRSPAISTGIGKGNLSVAGSLTNGEKAGSSGRAYWLVAKHESGRKAPLTVSLPDGGEALPVFSFEEEAEMFLWFVEDKDKWFTCKVTSGELISMLFGPRSIAENVALDPSPEIVAEMAVDLVTLSRERFVNRVAGEDGPRESRQEEGEIARGTPPWLPPGYNLDGSDPDILFLRRWDRSTVAAFSARGATKAGLREAAEADAGLVLR